MEREKMNVELYLIHTGFLDDDEIFRSKLRQVSEKRRERVLSHKIREDQKRSLAAGLLLERLIGERGYSGDLIKEGEMGKPYLPEVDDFFFSVSHSGEYAACVIGNVPVGVDIQKKRKANLNMARRFFKSEEAELIEKTLEEEKKEELFFRYWNGKESYLKLKGEGILGSLDSFFVDLSEKRIVDNYNHNENIYLREYKCLEDYFITVACYSSGFSTFVKKIYYRL